MFNCEKGRHFNQVCEVLLFTPRLVALQGAKSIPEDAIVRVSTVDVASSGNWNLSARIGLFRENFQYNGGSNAFGRH
jgi:hypothetical protein